MYNQHNIVIDHHHNATMPRSLHTVRQCGGEEAGHQADTCMPIFRISVVFLITCSYSLAVFCLGTFPSEIFDVAGLSEALTVFSSSNTGIMGLNPTRGVDVCSRFSVLVLSCVGRGLASG